MNLLCRFINWLMRSKEEVSSSKESLKEETRVISNVSEKESEIEFYDGKKSNELLAKHLYHLTRIGQMKSYKGINDFISSIEISDFSDAAEKIDFNLMVVTPEIMKFSKKANLLGYKYPYEEISNWLSEVYRGLPQA